MPSMAREVDLSFDSGRREPCVYLAENQNEMITCDGLGLHIHLNRYVRRI
jgi:hypothetical protein